MVTINLIAHIESRQWNGERRDELCSCGEWKFIAWIECTEYFVTKFWFHEIVDQIADPTISPHPNYGSRVLQSKGFKTNSTSIVSNVTANAG